jgi:hypothetical protein
VEGSDIYVPPFETKAYLLLSDAHCNVCTILFGRRSILYTTGSMCVLLAQNEFTARDFLSPYNDWSYVCLYNLIGTKIAISCF